MLINYVPVLIFMVVAIGLVAVIVFLSELLGKKKHFASKDMPYECGMDPIGDAWIRYSAVYYLYALVFFHRRRRPLQQRRKNSLQAILFLTILRTRMNGIFLQKRMGKALLLSLIHI